MSTPYTVSQNSVITSISSGQTPSIIKFLTCGGTNIAPKSGAWSNFTVGTTNFRYIFNVGKFNGTTSPFITGYPSNGTAPTTIKQSLFDKGSIQYICGQFPSFSTATGSAQNVVRFNPAVSSTAPAVFETLSNITFTGTSNAVNCMASDLYGTFSKIYLAGRFDTANIGGATTYKNMVCLDVDGTTYTIDPVFSTAGELLDSDTVTINSMIVINLKLYVAGTDGTNCIFFSFDGIDWVDLLLGVSPITGKINVLKAIDTTKIAIGGKFTSIGSATNCNNVAIFTISSTISDDSYTVLGDGGTKGVTDVAAVGFIYADPEVFALEYVADLLWVGGYFVNAGGNSANSIAIYNVPGNSWNPVKKDNAGTIGLLRDTGTIYPGVVYALYWSSNDASIMMVGGSFKTNISTVSPNKSEFIYNLVKITTATLSSTVTTRTYSKFNSLSKTTPTKN